MATKTLQPRAKEAWRLTRLQHGVVTRRQLLAMGMTPGAIRGRLESGRMHRLWPGTYAIGRPEVDRLGPLKAATLACGPDARLSHRSGAELWRLAPKVRGPVDVSVPRGFRSLVGIRLHRRADYGVTRLVKGIPVADPITVLIDLAAALPTEEVEDAVNEADRLDFFWPDLGSSSRPTASVITAPPPSRPLTWVAI